MFIMDDGIRLNAELDMPVGYSGGKYPVVLVLHGFTGHLDERHIEAVAKRMNELGCATLRLEMYGHGKSEGKFEDHTLYKWLTNVMTAVDYIKGLAFTDKIFLCGHSQGGMASVLAAAMERDVISGVIPMSPALCIPDDARSGHTLGCDYDPDHIPEEIHSPWGWTLKGNYIRVAQTIDVNAAIDKYEGPVLIVHGDADETVPCRYAVEAAERYKNAELALIPGDTHCYDNHLEMAVDAVGEWLKKQL